MYVYRSLSLVLTNGGAIHICRLVERTASGQAMKEYYDLFCRARRAEEELAVLRREITSAVSYFDMQLRLIDERLAVFNDNLPLVHSKDSGQRTLLRRLRGRVLAQQADIKRAKDVIFGDPAASTGASMSSNATCGAAGATIEEGEHVPPLDEESEEEVISEEDESDPDMTFEDE